LVVSLFAACQARAWLVGVPLQGFSGIFDPLISVLIAEGSTSIHD